MGATHFQAGFSIGLLIGSSQSMSDSGTLILGCIGALAALVPDIDHPGSYLRRRMGLLGAPLFWLKHRGLTHTLMFAALVGALALFALPEAVGLTVLIAYTSHLLMDAMTVSGAPLLWPLAHQSVRVLPIRIRTGSIIEAVFHVAALLLVWRIFFT